MKNLRLLSILFLTILLNACSDDDNVLPAQDKEFEALINGDSFSDYNFILGAYQITKGSTGNTLSLDFSDTSGQMITLFLNGTGGFNSGTIKQMGNIDEDDFITYALIRQSNPQLSFYSSFGNVTITNNRAHPTESNLRLISGTFNITASTVAGSETMTMTGSFTELEY